MFDVFVGHVKKIMEANDKADQMLLANLAA